MSNKYSTKNKSTKELYKLIKEGYNTYKKLALKTKKNRVNILEQVKPLLDNKYIVYKNKQGRQGRGIEAELIVKKHLDTAKYCKHCGQVIE